MRRSAAPLAALGIVAFLAIVVGDVRAEEPPPPRSGRYTVTTSTSFLLPPKGPPLDRLPGEGGPVEDEEAPQVPTVSKGVPKLESALQRLAGLYRQDAQPVPRFAEASDFTFSDGGVVVVVRASSGRLADVLEQVSVLGGRVVRTHGDLAKVSLPIDAMESLARMDEVEFVRRPYTGIPAGVVSEGVTRVGADSWHLGGILGEGVKVAIVDLGFQGYASLLGTELPDSVVAKSFRSDGDIEAGITHGVSVAEVVHDMAPKASLYLVNFDDEMDLSAAVDWLIAEGVDIVNHSIAWFNAGPGDESGFIDEIVERARNNGILWVNAAGNSAQRHWEALFSDPDGDGWHNYTATDLGNTFFGTAGQVVRIFLSWNGWPQSNQDYDLYLASSDGTLIGFSENNQTGTQPPVERIAVALPADDLYFIAIFRFAATQNVNLELFVTFNGLEYVVPSGSLTIPADSTHALAVGATHWTDDLLEPYSSLGPTTDGRTKPDISAPDCTTGSLGGFCGTSGSAPHVAGAAALVKQANPSFTPAEIQAFLENVSLDLGSPGLDNSYGWGRLRLPASSVVTVNSTADPGDGVCDLAECTLREAINGANASAVVTRFRSTSQARGRIPSSQRPPCRLSPRR